MPCDLCLTAARDQPGLPVLPAGIPGGQHVLQVESAVVVLVQLVEAFHHLAANSCE